MSVSARGSAVERAADILGRLGQREVPLAPLTTYRVGGAARLFVRVEHRDQLAVLRAAVAASGLPVVVIGRGSNLLVADAGFDGIAVTFGDVFAEIEIRGTDVVAGGFTLLPVLARRTVAAGLAGLEWAVGVPGSVGGGVRMNAGGHGSDVAASIVDVELFDLGSGEFVMAPAAALGLRFRGSDLRDDQLVLSARFALTQGSVDRGEAELAEVVRWRREHQPGGQNAGSVFVNPIPGELAAGQVIDELGLRGTRIGSAFVSEKHANFIQSTEGGSAADVRDVIEFVRARVWQERGIQLRSEIRMIGFDGAGS